MTTIEWTHRPGTKGESWNPIRARNKKTGGVGHYCVKVSAGCAGCYAERRQPRFRNPIRYAAQDADKVEIFLDEKVLMKPLHWRAPRTVFICSMTDLFGEWVTDEMLDRIFAVMALCPQHTFLVLTKRPERMRAYMATNTPCCRLANAMADMAIPWDQQPKWSAALWPLPNVWAGTSVEDQPTADERIPHLLATAAAVRFVSYEPALGPVDLTYVDCGEDAVVDALGGWGRDAYFTEGRSTPRLDMVIWGGESGPRRRPVDMEWGRSTLAQCRAGGVAFFGKQVDKVIPLPDDLRVREWPR